MSDHLLRTLLKNLLLSLHPPLSLSSSWTCHSHLSLAHLHCCNNAHSSACTWPKSTVVLLSLLTHVPAMNVQFVWQNFAVRNFEKPPVFPILYWSIVNCKNVIALDPFCYWGIHLEKKHLFYTGRVAIHQKSNTQQFSSSEYTIPKHNAVFVIFRHQSTSVTGLFPSLKLLLFWPSSIKSKHTLGHKVLFSTTNSETVTVIHCLNSHSLLWSRQE